MRDYKVINLKTLSLELKISSSKKFNRPENYLEYVIKMINDKSGYDFHQFLFLIDILYVILIEKDEAKSFDPANPLDNQNINTGFFDAAKSVKVPVIPAPENPIKHQPDKKDTFELDLQKNQSNGYEFPWK